MHSKIIGLLGQAGAGKTTAASYLERFHSFEHLAFADPIIGMVSALLEDAGAGQHWMTERQFKERTVPALGISYRCAAQTLGDWGRGIRPDFWVHIAQRKVEAARAQTADVVFGDVRYRNEADMLRQQGGTLVRIVREGLPPVREHSSESEGRLIPADVTIFNNTSTSTLYAQLDRLVAQLDAEARAA